MKTVENFREIRRDGLVIEEGTSLERFFELGLSSEKISKIEWTCGGKNFSILDSRGLTCVVLPDRSGIALILRTAQSQDEVLGVVNADGTSRFCLGNIHEVNGKRVTGRYRWFETSRTKKATVFGVVFGYTIKSQKFTMNPDVHFDVDAMTGEIVFSHPTM